MGQEFHRPDRNRSQAGRADVVMTQCHRHVCVVRLDITVEILISTLLQQEMSRCFDRNIRQQEVPVGIEK